jgi:enoyl-CoA hydratase/carnithine racemase
VKTNELLKEVRDRVCILSLNRPEKRNSLSPVLLKQLTATLRELAEEDVVRAIIIRGTGDKAFCAGYDLNQLPTGNGAAADSEGINPFEIAMETVLNFPYPVIAMLNGYAFGGGCDLAASCDIRIGAEDIRIGMIPAKLGVVYAASGLRRFIRVIGQARTREMFFTGRHYTAPFLREIGFLNYLLPRTELESFTYTLAEEIAANAPLSLKGTKRILGLIEEATKLDSRDLQEADEIATRSFFSDDLKEGQAAFFEKRKPEFKGR